MSIIQELFKDYSTKEEWKGVLKTHENLFTIGAEAILLRQSLLLKMFFEQKQNDEWKLLNEAQQLQFEKEFSDFCCNVISVNSAFKIISSFEEASRPLMKYLGENHHPHTSAYVRNDLAELLEGQEVFGTKDYILD